MGSTPYIVFILLLGAAVLGFIAAWLIRQKLIDKLTNLVLEVEQEKENSVNVSDQYETDRALLKEEVEKYKEKYNTQLKKTQRLSENIRQNQAEMDRLQHKVSNLTEMSLKAQQENNLLKQQLSSPRPSVQSIKITQPSPIKRGGLSLLDKSVQ